MNDTVSIECEKCGRELEISIGETGSTIRCECGNVIEVGTITSPDSPSDEEEEFLSAEDVARKWYYARGKQRYGPVSLGMLKRLTDEGKVQLSDLAWTRGIREWIPISELSQIERELPPPLPKAESVEERRETPEQSDNPGKVPEKGLQKGTDEPGAQKLDEGAEQHLTLGFRLVRAVSWGVTLFGVLLLGLVHLLLLGAFPDLGPATRSEQLKVWLAVGGFACVAIGLVCNVALRVSQMEKSLTK
ncbi:MAG: DUF4339 domain-containing protein [Planctomycetes bacterium]|nr:DUF4339 domain-containing protein [Planctomycetota bacterium]